jgi:hypothetical protein
MRESYLIFDRLVVENDVTYLPQIQNSPIDTLFVRFGFLRQRILRLFRVRTNQLRLSQRRRRYIFTCILSRINTSLDSN